VTAPGSQEATREALARLDRRGFLRLAGGLAAAGLLPTGCGGEPWRVPAALAPPGDLRLESLSPRGYATFQAFAMRLAGPSAAAAIAARELDPAAAADRWVARLPARGGALGKGLAALEWGVWPLLPKWRPFTALDGVAQDQVIEDLSRSRMDAKRDLYRGLKSLATLVVYTDPAARAWIGHPGPFDAAGIRAAMAWPEGS
jgi:hypothetical protein